MLKPDFWVSECSKTDWPKLDSKKNPIRVGDFFSGCGGLTLGIFIACANARRNMDVKIAADIWEDAVSVYKDNFASILTDAKVLDLSTVVKSAGSVELSPIGESISNAIGTLDIVVAGPPCQGHSDLNNSSRRDDPRNLLYSIPTAFALKNNAKIMIIENVPNVVHATGKVVGSALEELQKNGYAVVEFLADIQNFGLPQTRKRHLLIASRVHKIEELQKLLASQKRRTVDIPLWPIIQDIEDENEDPSRLITKRTKISLENRSRIAHLFSNEIFDLPDSLRPACHRDKAHSYVSMYGRLRKDRPAQTITSGFGSMGQGRFVHPTRERTITAHEAARIQGFPDYFSFDSVKKVTALREMIGNAVPPAVTANLIALLLEKI